MGREKAMGQSTSTMVPRTCVPPNVAPGMGGRALHLVGSPDLCLTCGSTKGRQTLGPTLASAHTWLSGLLVVQTSVPCLSGLDSPQVGGKGSSPGTTALIMGWKLDHSRPLPSLTPQEPTAPPTRPQCPHPGEKDPLHVASPGSRWSAFPLWTLPQVHCLGSAMCCRDERPPPAGRLAHRPGTPLHTCGQVGMEHPGFLGPEQACSHAGHSAFRGAAGLSVQPGSDSV